MRGRIRFDFRCRLMNCGNGLANWFVGTVQRMFCFPNLLIPGGLKFVLGFVELAKPLAQRLAEFGQFLRSKNHQGNNEYENELGNS